MTRYLWSCLQVVFSQQVLGYPRRRDLTLKCELFGLAGHYVLTLRSKLPTLVPVMQREPAHIKVNWRRVDRACLIAICDRIAVISHESFFNFFVQSSY